MVTKLLPTGDVLLPDETSHQILPSRHCLWLSLNYGQRIQTRAFFCDDGAGGVCRVWTAFYTHRAARGTTAEERSAYAIGLKAGEQAPVETILPTDAELNMMAQKYFKQRGPATSRVGTSRSKTVTRTGSRRRTAAEPNAEGSSHSEVCIVCIGHRIFGTSLQSQSILNENRSGNV